MEEYIPLKKKKAIFFSFFFLFFFESETTHLVCFVHEKKKPSNDVTYTTLYSE